MASPLATHEEEPRLLAAPALVSRDLLIGYGALPIAKVEDIALAPGQATLALGPSGSGKSTLLFTLAGLARPLGGSIELGGAPFSAVSARERDRIRRRRIGLIFQDVHLLSGLSVLQNVLLAPLAVGVQQDRQRAAMLLQKVGLGGILDSKAERLSRGQAQRVAVARAMMLRPAVILADEPTASLDDDSAAATVDLLLEAAGETDAALVIATHDARLKDRIAGRIRLEPAP